MANLSSALKRIRSNEKKRKKNKYQHKTAKTFAQKIRKRATTNSDTLSELNKLYSMYDKLAKAGIIHKNKSARKKSIITRHVNQLRTT